MNNHGKPGTLFPATGIPLKTANPSPLRSFIKLHDLLKPHIDKTCWFHCYYRSDRIPPAPPPKKLSPGLVDRGHMIFYSNRARL